jgi:hypothetical protein
MALRNNDVIYTTNTSYNYDRFVEFLDNVSKGKPDRIRIVSYGFEGQVLISILHFDGNIIRITFDATRNQTSEKYDSFYGYQIISQIYERAGKKLVTYNLVTYDNNYMPVFTDISIQNNISNRRGDLKMNCNYPEEILASLPRDYTVEMALENGDVLYAPEGQSYNVERLHQFMANVNRRTPDCIILTVFGIEPPAVTKVLYYDGEKIAYTYDTTRVSEAYKIQTIYGTNIFAVTHKPTQFTETTYFLDRVGEKPWIIFRDYLEI